MISETKRPASWYCPIRSMASDTVPTKPRNGPRAASRSRFAATAAALRASSQCSRRVAITARSKRPMSVLDVEIPAVESRPRLGPHLENEPDRFLHLPDARRRPRRELPAILPVFILEKAGADAERQSSP